MWDSNGVRARTLTGSVLQLNRETPDTSRKLQQPFYDAPHRHASARPAAACMHCSVARLLWRRLAPWQQFGIGMDHALTAVCCVLSTLTSRRLARFCQPLFS